jgi:Zn-dependent protease
MQFDASNILIILGSLLLALSFHEAMHAFVGHALGDTTAAEEGRLTLNPLKHIDFLTTIAVPLILILFGLPPILAAKPVPFNPARVKWEEFGAALIGVAGPLANLGLAVVTASIIHLVQPDPASLLLNALLTFLEVNVGLFIFNMLPIPPLDGSRLLYAFAPESLQRVMYQMESFGILAVMVILFALLPVLSPLLQSLNSSILTILL